jgi:hypothetical protein
MKPVTITITGEAATALLWALREHANARTPVREYVDKRYSTMDEGFRNYKIGLVQGRIDMLWLLINHVQNELTKQQWQQLGKEK